MVLKIGITTRKISRIERTLTFHGSTFIESPKDDLMQKSDAEETARYADMLAALGSEARLRIVRLLLAAHPEGLVVGEIGSELGIPPSTLSHHLDKLKNEELVTASRRHLPLVHGELQQPRGAPWFSLCRVLRAQPGRRAPQHRLCCQ